MTNELSANPKKKFSIVIPVFQNELNLYDSIPELLALSQKITHYNFELIFVNDGSTDASLEILTEFQSKYPNEIVVVNLTRNFGQTPAIREGLKVSSGDCVGIISADLQDPPELFLKMLKVWEQGKKLVIAERNSREEGIFHSFFSGLYWKMVSKYAVTGFPKGGFDFCILDKQIRNDVVSIGEKNTSIFPLIFWLGYDYEIIHYTRKKRLKGKSQWTLSKKIMLTVNTFINFTYLPVKLMSFIGISVSSLAFIYSIFVFIRSLFFGTSVEGWTTIVMLTSVLGGLILLFLGIIGEYLWRILDEVRKRPSVVTDKVIKKNQEIGRNNI